MAVCQLFTLFGPIRDRNITFCIDTSGSTYHSLPMVKRHLVDFLESRAREKSAGLFNLIEFSSTVHQWADKMVNCNPATVHVAKEWIHKLDAKTGTNTLDALLAAYADRDCDAVVLVTDGRPDTPTSDMLEYVVYASRGRPLYVAYVIGSEDSHDTHEATQLYRALAEHTLGALDIIIMSRRGGDIERITPVYHAGTDRDRFLRTTSNSVYVNPVPTRAVPMEPVYHPLRYTYCDVGFWEEPWPSYMVVGPRVYSTRDSLVPLPSIAWSRHRPLRIRSDGRIIDHHCAQTFEPVEIDVCYAPDAGAMLIGKQMLARRDTDGFYYRGTVRSQILAHKFLVEFSPCSLGKFTSTTYQETPLYDIIHWDDALRHSIVPGDKVLAAWEPSGDRFGPGEVLQGVERRCDVGLGPDCPLTIVFFNGKTATIPANRAIWVPRAMHERVKFELVMPVTARKYLEEESEEYPRRTLPGYPEAGLIPRPPNHEIVMPRMLFDRWPYFVPLYPIFRKHCPEEHTHAVRSEELNSLVDTGITAYDLTRKVDSQIAHYRDLIDEPRLLPRRPRCKSAHKDHREHRDHSAHREHGEHEHCAHREHPEHVDYRQHRGHSAHRHVDEDGLSSGSDAFEDELEELENELDDLMHIYDRKDHGSRMVATTQTQQDAGTNTDLSLYYSRKGKTRVKSTAPWRYWKHEPTVQLKATKHEPYELGRDPTGMENLKEMRRHFEDSERSVIPSYLCPHPPPRTTAAFESRIARLRHQRDNIDIVREKARRNKGFAREKHLVERIDELERRCDASHLYRKAEVRDRFHKERERMEHQEISLERTRVQKQKVETQLRAQYGERVRDKEQEKLDARRRQVIQREASKLSRDIDSDMKTMRLQMAKEIKQQAQFHNQRSQIFQHDHEEHAREQRSRQAQIQRIESFRQTERRAQNMKEMGTQVTEQNGSIFRASLFN